MKKFFSLIALVGVFAACQPEELQTIFQSVPAQLSVNVTKVINSVNGADVTATAQKTNYGPIAGNPDIPAGTATVSATYNGATGTTTVPYPRILADTAPVVLEATVYIPGSLGNYTIDVKQTADPDNKELVKEYILLEAKTHGFYNDDPGWLANASDLTISDSFTYKMASGYEMDGNFSCNDDAFKDVVSALYDTVKDGAGLVEVEAAEPFKFQVPAWSLYKASNKVYKAPVTYEVTATPSDGAPTVGNNGVIGTFKTKAYTNVANVEFKEYPGHSGHAGHGGHGNGSNAGGGLVPAE